MKILISAYNINSGGGKLLLEGLIASAGSIEMVVFADSRIERSLIQFKKQSNIELQFVRPSFVSRLIAEYKISLMSGLFEKHICLGNLPPLYRSRSEVIIYLHSRYMVDRSLDSILPFRKRLITQVERLWFHSRSKTNHLVIVQTKTMEFLLRKVCGDKFLIKQIAFAPEITCSVVKKKNRENFLYVASFDPHKNHEKLLDAWYLLHLENISPKLTMILPIEAPKELKDKALGLNIDFVINTKKDELDAFYASSDCLIYPAFFESLGLVLLEAKAFGLDIIAPEADYVRDVVEPVQTFDPHSELSISRAVKRYLAIDEKKMVVESPSSFWNKVL